MILFFRSIKKLIRRSSFSFLFFVFSIYSSDSFSQFSWYQQTTGTTEIIKDLFFLNDQEGWAVGTGGVIRHTTNAGITWTAQGTGNLYNYHEVFFINNMTGWIVAESGYIFKTINGGTDWNLIWSTGTIASFESVYFVNPLTGWACGSNGALGKLYKTTDGGSNWSEQTSIGTPGPLNKIDFVSSTEGWVVGESGIYHTSDGLTWTFQFATGSVGFQSISMVDLNKGWAVCNGGFILNTTDGGDTWFYQSSPATVDLFDVEFITNIIGVAVGESGTLLYTVDGTNWAGSTDFITSLNFYTVELTNLFTAYVGGTFGSIFKSPSEDNDLVIVEYLGFDTLCANVSTPVNVTIMNNGPGNIEQANIGIMQGSNVILIYTWTGNLASGEFENVNLGNVSIDYTGTYTGVISGDSIITNNLSDHDIQIIQKPGDVNGPHTICSGDSVEIIAFGGASYVWFNLGADSTNSSQIVSPLISQNYLVQIQTGYCTVVDTVIVNVDPCLEPISAFSPNGDGINDVLIIDGIKDVENTVKIYNRWGDIVNSFTNYNNETTVWDGTHSSGVTLESGTYFYTFEAPSLGINSSGWVQIVINSNN